MKMRCFAIASVLALAAGSAFAQDPGSQPASSSTETPSASTAPSANPTPNSSAAALDYPVELANQVNASLEITKDVQNSIETFHYKLDRNELASATDRLQEAFMVKRLSQQILGNVTP